MTREPRRTIIPGQRNVVHAPAKPLDPLSEQIHHQYRERQQDLKARYARIKPAETAPEDLPNSPLPAPLATSAEPAIPTSKATPTTAEEAEEAWIASLVAEHRAGEGAEENR